MCTAATYQTNDFYFGRTLDYESSYGKKSSLCRGSSGCHFCTWAYLHSTTP